MKRTIDANTVKVLLERFGEPIGKAEDIGPGVADEKNDVTHNSAKKNNKNYGWGVNLSEIVCNGCGFIHENLASNSQNCNESENGGRHPGHASSCTCPDCIRNPEDVVDEIAPPGEEKLVKALKKQKGIKNPWAVAWSQYNKKYKIT